MEFSITPSSGLPIYQQLTEQICAAIARGRLAADQRLPSVREMSQALVINPNTVARAYTELERDGTLYTRPGMGVFVSKSPPPLPIDERRERLAAALEPLLVAAVRYGSSPGELIALVEERAGGFRWNRAKEEAAARQVSAGEQLPKG
jgi:GntR family transcriptional regulator